MKDLNGYKIFLRVEDYCGVGAYRCGAASKAGIISESDRTHPTPDFDAGLRGWWRHLCFAEQQQYIFGFSKPSQYLNWFLHADGRDALEEDHRYRLNLYFVPDTATVEGQFQAVAHSSYIEDAISLPMNLELGQYQRILEELCQTPITLRRSVLENLLPE